MGITINQERKVKRNVMSIFPENNTMPAPRSIRTMDPELREAVEGALRQMRVVPGFKKVRFILLHGSAAEGHATPDSDIDLCVYYEGTSGEAGRFRHAILSRLPTIRYDVQVFQLLPLYVRVEILRGIPVFVRDERFLYETAIRTIREFEDFKHRLYDYTGQASIV